MGWHGDTGSAADQESWIAFTDELRAGAPTIGSVMVTGDAPLDPNGLPVQFIVRVDDEGRVVGLVTTDDGHPLTWVLTADGTGVVEDEGGRAALRPAPVGVAEAAWEWLEDQRSGPGA